MEKNKQTLTLSENKVYGQLVIAQDFSSENGSLRFWCCYSHIVGKWFNFLASLYP